VDDCKPIVVDQYEISLIRMSLVVRRCMQCIIGYIVRQYFVLQLMNSIVDRSVYGKVLSRSYIKKLK